MTEINLLPWREERVRVKNNLFYLIAFIVVVGCSLICVTINSYIQNKVDCEISEAKILSEEINKLEGQIVQIKGLQEKQKLLLSRSEIIQALQASRPFIVQLFEEIAQVMPEGLYLTSMQRKDNKFILQGASNSNTRVSTLMRNLERLPWLKNTTLQEIKTENITQDARSKGEKMRRIVFKLQGEINF